MSESFEEAVIEQMTETQGSPTEIEKQPLTEQPGQSSTPPDNWQGDKRYFQTGKKAGQLKPSADSGAQPTALPSLDFGDLNSTAKTPQPAPAQIVPDKKAQKAQKNIILAKSYSKIIMRLLDVFVSYISGGTYGSDFTALQTSDRNAYRDELDNQWVEFLQELELVGHPALVVLAGSAIYVMPALHTIKGEEKTRSLKEKIFGKIAMSVFSRGRK